MAGYNVPRLGVMFGHMAIGAPAGAPAGAVGAPAGAGAGAAPANGANGAPASTFQDICNGLRDARHHQATVQAPRSALVSKIDNMRKQAEIFSRAQKYAPPDARTTIMGRFEEKFGQIIRVYTNARISYLMPFTTIHYAIVFDSRLGTMEQLLFAISKAKMGAVKDWRTKLREYIARISDIDDVEDDPRSSSGLLYNQHKYRDAQDAEDTNFIYAREIKYTTRILDAICNTLDERMRDVYMFLWVYKKTDCIAPDVMRVIVEYIKNGG